MEASLPSFLISFRDAQGRQIELTYSEHHLDYDAGISVKMDGARKGSFAAFGTLLLRRNDTQIMDRFFQFIK